MNGSLKTRAMELLDPTLDIGRLTVDTSLGQTAIRLNLRRPPGPGVILPETIDGVPLRLIIAGSPTNLV